MKFVMIAVIILALVFLLWIVISFIGRQITLLTKKSKTPTKTISLGKDHMKQMMNGETLEFEGVRIVLTTNCDDIINLAINIAETKSGLN